MAPVNLDGVDVDWVRAKLDEYVSETRAVSSSRPGVITPWQHPQCGRPHAIELTELVRPILERLYPEWRVENGSSKYDEFKQERDAASRLRARLDVVDDLAVRLGLGDNSPSISASGMHPLIWKAAEPQWLTGHRHEAVLAASKAVNSLLQAKLHRRDVSETDLVKQAFSTKSPEPGKPRLRFDVGDEQTSASLTVGVMQFGAGCFQAIRNPLGHLPNEQIELSEQTALERLAALSLLARWVDEAEIVEHYE